MGVIYTRTTQQTPLREAPSDREREDLLERFYRPHHRDLTAAVDRALSQHGTCLVIDAHSFPAQPLTGRREAEHYRRRHAAAGRP